MLNTTMKITASEEQLRQATGAGMMDCKKFAEAEGDFDKAEKRKESIKSGRQPALTAIWPKALF